MLRRIIYNDHLIFTLIIINVLVIYLHSFDFLLNYFYFIECIDIAFTLFFVTEIGVKIYDTKSSNKLKTYLKSPWNRIDIISILFALPSIGVLFDTELEVFAGFATLRSLRIFKLLRVIEYIPEGKRISEQLYKALKSIWFIIIAFFIYTTIVSLISVSLFKHIAPLYFQNAFESFYTIFKIFSGDGFSDVVAVIQQNSSETFASFSKFYFVFVVFSGSILGLSLINSVFIDQMNMDNRELEEIQDLKKEVKTLKEQQEEILGLLRNRMDD